MPLFDYTGQLQNGTTLEGRLMAETSTQAEETLRDMGVRALSLREAKLSPYVAPLSVDDMTFLNDNIAALARAGLPLDEGLRKLAADTPSARLKRLILDIADDLTRGVPLEQAVAQQARRFPTDYAGIVSAGLRTGDLAGALQSLAAQLRLRSDVRQILWEVCSYPLAVLVITWIILSLFVRYLVPQLIEMRSEILGLRLDLGSGPVEDAAPSGFMWFLTALVREWPRLELGGFAVLSALVLGLLALLIPAMRSARETVLRMLPGISGIYRASVLARFSHVCAIGARTGRPLSELLTAGAAASGSLRLRAAAERIAERLNNGAAFAEASHNEPEIPALFVGLVQATAARGDLPSALAELAMMYEQRARQRAAALRMILGPVMFIVTGALVGSVVIGILWLIVEMLRALTALG